MMRIAVIGAGYVGLTSGVCLAALGHEVAVIDLHKGRVEALRRLQLPIVEEGLEELLKEHQHRLTFHTHYKEAIPGRDVILLAVGTPPAAHTEEADLSYVFAAAEAAVNALPSGSSIVLTVKSTVPAGTCNKLQLLVNELRQDVTVRVASNPEFLREGMAVHDFMNPDRIVVGCADQKAFDALSELYAPLTQKGATLLRYGRTAAELVKYASNGFLALKIAYINEISNICEALGADIGDVADGMGTDTRIGRAFLNAGPGYGGSCFPKDTRALREQAASADVECRLIEAAVVANDRRAYHLLKRFKELASPLSIAQLRVTVLGAAFKAGTDDVRESPALRLVARLLTEGVHVTVADPAATANAAKVLPPATNLRYCTEPTEAAKDADAIILATEWPEFAEIAPSSYQAVMRQDITPLFYDTRRIFTKEMLEAAGFKALVLGQG